MNLSKEWVGIYMYLRTWFNRDSNKQSENQRTVCVGRDVKDHLISTPIQGHLLLDKVAQSQLGL